MPLLTRAIRKLGPLGSAVMAAQVASLAREHWQSLSSDERARLRSLLARSHGRPSNLSKAERRELSKLIGALNLPRLLRRSVLNVAGIRRQLRVPPE
jgi:hypothetical protein